MDTNACLFFGMQSDRLSEAAYHLITSPETTVHTSPVTAMELACLQERKKIELSKHWRTWFREQNRINGWACDPITLEIVQEGWSLPGLLHRDPADRILIATARLGNMTIVTTDRLILDYPHVSALS